MSVEQRIRQQRKSLRGFAHEYGVGVMWLMLARQWKLPVQDIKRICHCPGWDPVAERERKNKVRAEVRDTMLGSVNS